MNPRRPSDHVRREHVRREHVRRDHVRRDHDLHDLAGLGPRLASVALPRRTVLRAAGVALALPWLEAMASGSPVGGRPTSRAPRRLVYAYVPNGIRLDEWRTDLPTVGEGRKSGPAPGTYALEHLPPLLEPLAPFRSKLQVLRGLTQHTARANGDGPGDHARAAAAYLTGVQPLKTEGRVRLGISADQLVAREVGDRTRLRSLVLGLERGRQSGQCDSGYACAYSGHISWESETVPAAKEVEPQRAFDRIFRGGDASLSEAARKGRLAERRSVLDFVRGESKRLGARLGSADRDRIDEYETGLRELERQLRFDGAAHVDGAPDDARPSEEPTTFSEHARLMGEILAIALATDVSRVATLMYANEGSNRRYPEVDVRDGHHALSHHGGDPEKLAAIGRINRLHMAAFAGLLEALHGAREAGGRVLDSTTVVFGSGIAEGNRHDHHDLPVLLVAGRNAGLERVPKGGRIVAFERETPMNDLHLTLAGKMGVQGASLGDGRGPLREIGG